MTISVGVAEVVAAADLDHWFRLADSALPGQEQWPQPG